MRGHCIDCEFAEKQAVTQNGQHGMIYFCLNSACADPVTATPVPCQLARAQAQICGWKGEHFKKKQKQETGKVIQIDPRLIGQ